MWLWYQNRPLAKEFGGVELKAGNLVKRRDPCWGAEQQLGLVLDMETVQYAHIAKVKWVGIEDPPFMYRIGDLILVSEGK